MGRWINEDPVFKVVVDTPRFQIYEQGLLASARAIARILRGIARMAELLSIQYPPSDANNLLDIARQASVLATRIRYGIREDIATSPLGIIAARVPLDDLVNSQGYPEFIMRIVLRLISRKGVSDANSLSEYQGRKLVTLRDLRRYPIDGDTANHISRYHRAKVDDIANRIIAASIRDPKAEPKLRSTELNWLEKLNSFPSVSSSSP